MAGVPQPIGQFPNLADYGDILLAFFDEKYDRYPPLYTRYFNSVKGDRRTERITGIIGPTELETVSEGQATPYVDILEDYITSVSFQKWAKGIQFTEEAVMFDKTNRLGRSAEKFALSARHTEETRAARVLNNCTSTNHADTGQPLVSNSQPIKRTGGTFDNRIDGDLSVAALDSAMVQFRNMVDGSNLKINVSPAYLIVTPTDERVARQLVGSPQEPYTADNQINYLRGRAEVIVNPWLTDADTWFLVARPEENGLYYVSWKALARKAWVDNDADALKFKATEIMEATFADWRGLVGGIGA